MSKAVARLTTPAEMVASLPLQLGYQPAESLVVVCCYEPRGRQGMTIRVDLPAREDEEAFADEVVRRVRQQRADRVVVAVYTDEPDVVVDVVRRAGEGLVDLLRDKLADLVFTEAVLIRDGHFWSYLCRSESCCPAAGTPVQAGWDSPSIRLLEAERVLEGRAVLPDRESLEASIAGPTFLRAIEARQRCEVAAALLGDAIEEVGAGVAGTLSLESWGETVGRFRNPPAQLGDMEAAALAVSLVDVWVRDQLASSPSRDLPTLLLVLEELARRTPPPFDAAVCTLLAWITYGQGGGSLVTIALERALRSDPTYSLAQLLDQMLQAQISPKQLRRLTRAGRRLERRAC
jgi:hypothetical protein